MNYPCGRIWFRGSPWPKGHALEALVWSGRLDSDGRLWFDLHLETRAYAKSGKAAFDHKDDWRSTVVWKNYNNCTLSSTAWADEGSTGILVGSEARPFTWQSVSAVTLLPDPVEQNQEHDGSAEHPFLIYLLGHDGVAGHRVNFKKCRSGAFDLTWTGRIALVYAGQMKLQYRFRVEALGVRFQGFRVEPSVDAEAAPDMFRRACRDAAMFETIENSDDLWFVPRKSKPTR